MTPLSFQGFALEKGGLTATFNLQRGESLAVMGPAASGKSRLIEVIQGEGAPVRGKVKREGEVSSAGGPLGRRSRPQAIAQKGPSVSKAVDASESLSACGLWDHRQTPVSDLSPSQIAACELLTPLSSGAHLLVVDGQLERIDPWALRGVLELLRKRMADGAAVVAATHRLDLALEFDWVILLKSGQIRYAGRTRDLAQHGQETLTVETSNQAAVKALGRPFEVHAEETEGGLLMKAGAGQELAAKLLVQGYGDVRTVLVRSVSVEEVLRGLVEGKGKG